MRVIGVDFGIKSFDVIGFEDGRIKFDFSYLSEVVVEDFGRIVKVIEEFNVDIIIGLSGYGVLFKYISEFIDRDCFEMILVREEEMKEIFVFIGF